jgi:hypothetical protein
MNPPDELPPGFNEALYHEHEARAGLIPEQTADCSQRQSFSRPFAEEDIIWVKGKIRKRPAKSAKGVDGIHYHSILSIDNSKLCQFFNECITQQDVPNLWLSTILVAILKPGKLASDADSYRIIALESCLLKILTLLINRRLREWMEDRNILPDSQNGF